MKALWVVTMVPDPATGEKLARALVEERLAACVQVGGAVRSYYRWEGKMEEAVEYPVSIKTIAGHWESLRERVVELHPHQCPEILALRVEDGYGPYLQWLAGECGSREGPA